MCVNKHHALNDIEVGKANTISYYHNANKEHLNNFMIKSIGGRQKRLCNALKLVLKMSMLIQDNN